MRKFKEKDKKEGRKRKVGQKEKEINIKQVKKSNKLQYNTHRKYQAIIE